MSKLTMATNKYVHENYELDMADERQIASDAFVAGFTEAFNELITFLDEEKELIKPYGYMGERTHVINVLQRKIDDLMKEIENNGQ